MRKAHTGIFKPLNPQKYRGDVNNIVYRSSWEKRAFEWADLNPSVLEWASEEIVIPYLCETDNRIHRYFVDLYIKVKTVDGGSSKFIVEIKPYAQTQVPQPPKSGRQNKRYIEEMMAYVKNQSKWKAANEFAKKTGIQFKILTERELGIGRKK